MNRKRLAPEHGFIFAERLRDIRRQRGMTTKELGALIGRTDIQIQRYETPHRTTNQQPTVDSIRKLCVALQCPPSMLLGLDILDCETNPEDGVIYEWAVEVRGVNKQKVLVWTCPHCNMCNIMYEYNQRHFHGATCEYSECGRVYNKLWKELKRK